MTVSMPAPIISSPPFTEVLSSLQTEQRNQKSERIDEASSLELCGESAHQCRTSPLAFLTKRPEIINNEDDSVAKAVKSCLPQIAQVIDGTVPRILTGGRVIYMGAGTSGR